MHESQRFAISAIYCAPSEDMQFTVKMARINKPSAPAQRTVPVYRAHKALPNTTSKFHVFTLGNVNPRLMNLVLQRHEWFKDEWVQVSRDMETRDYDMKIYNEAGLVLPREYVYYSYINESALLVALECKPESTIRFDMESFEYLHIYSPFYLTEGGRAVNGIKLKGGVANNNSQKVLYQQFVLNNTTQEDQAIVYVNGQYTPRVNLNIADGSYIEVVIDPSIIRKERYKLSELRTFVSTLDARLKYLLYRERTVDAIEYHDDTTLYIHTDPNENLVPLGLFYYKHSPRACRNVTDKDFSVDAVYANNMAETLSTLQGDGAGNKFVTIYTRRSSSERFFPYSSTKLHELYRLPLSLQHDVLCNVNHTFPEFRAEALEASLYFQLAGAKLRDITTKFATDVLGYNGCAYHLANTFLDAQAQRTQNEPYLSVPANYGAGARLITYQPDGKLDEIAAKPYDFTRVDLSGSVLKAARLRVCSDELRREELRDILYAHNAQIDLTTMDFRVMSAAYVSGMRVSKWTDITDNTSKVTHHTPIEGISEDGASAVLLYRITLNETSERRVKIVRLDDTHHYSTVCYPEEDGVLKVPVYATYLSEDTDTLEHRVPEFMPSHIEVYLNKHRLAYSIDYDVVWPAVHIYSKEYIDYSKPGQEVEILFNGFAEEASEINATEITGFVNNGAVGRNRRYDMLEDRLIECFVAGKYMHKEELVFADDDSTSRTAHALNGKPYSLFEPFISIGRVTGLNTLPYYKKNLELNARIAQFIQSFAGEPVMNDFQTISRRYFLFSPTISKLIHDVLEENIPPSLYTNAYDFHDVVELLSDRYADLMAIDPARKEYPENVVEIHPHYGNETIDVSLLQYRFIEAAIRALTTGTTRTINLSGYLLITH